MTLRAFSVVVVLEQGAEDALWLDPQRNQSAARWCSRLGIRGTSFSERSECRDAKRALSLRSADCRCNWVASCRTLSLSPCGAHSTGHLRLCCLECSLGSWGRLVSQLRSVLSSFRQFWCRRWDVHTQCISSSLDPCQGAPKLDPTPF